MIEDDSKKYNIDHATPRIGVCFSLMYLYIYNGQLVGLMEIYMKPLPLRGHGEFSQENMKNNVATPIVLRILIKMEWDLTI